jgi:two-component system chemotaxis sensor kinase CheA
VEVSQYLDLFVAEAQDHLQEMNAALLALEDAPDNLVHLESFFRAAHTLKGMSAALGFAQVAGLAHEMEDVLDLLRKRERRLSPDLANILFRCLDVLTGQVQGIAAGEGAGGDTAEIEAALRAALEAPAPAAVPPPNVTAPETGWEIQVEVAADCLLKGPRAYLLLKKARAVAPLQGSDPPEVLLRAGQYEQLVRLFFSPDADTAALERTLGATAEVVSVAIAGLGETGQGVREPAAPRPAEQPPPDALRRAPPTAAPPPPAAEVRKPAPPAETGAAGAPAALMVRIKVSLLDRLLESVADLVINRSRMAQISRRHALPDLEEAVESYTTSLDRLQEAVLAMRMTPVAQVLSRFPRMVRDLAHSQGKEVRFEMEGTEIELDRTILEKITDPLVHLLRNAVDHGVETAEERRQRGKPLPARITLRTRRLQDKALIEIVDDGQGMDAARIGRLAVERGIVTAQELAEMDEPAVLELICRPGFSTKADVTGVSGRGVGMDVVKRAMDEVNGTLAIETQPGEGSCLRLTLPLTMAIIPALLVETDGATYALPLTHVVRTLDVPATAVRWLHDQPVYDWEERILPLIRLGDLLGSDARPAFFQTAAAEDGLLSIVVVERGRQRYGLVVDEIAGKEEIVLKTLTPMLQQIEELAGATIRGEGEIVLVLDVPSLVRQLTRDEGGRQR